MTNKTGVRFSSGQGGSIRGAPFAGLYGDPSRAPRQLRIIVADDDRDQVLTLMTLLRDEGHDVWGLYRGKDLLQAVKDFRPDVMLLDIQLPDVSGFTVAESISKQYGERKPLLIAISGVYNKGSDRILCELVGFDHHLTKPFSFDTVLRLIAPLSLPDGNR